MTRCSFITVVGKGLFDQIDGTKKVIFSEVIYKWGNLQLGNDISHWSNIDQTWKPLKPEIDFMTLLQLFDGVKLSFYLK